MFSCCDQKFAGSVQLGTLAPGCPVRGWDKVGMPPFGHDCGNDVRFPRREGQRCLGG